MNPEQKKMMTEFMKALGGGSFNEAAEIKFAGSAITLPPGMTEDEAIEVLGRRRDEMEETVAVNELIAGYPLDALLALQRAMKAKYGWTSINPSMGFFGPRPPAMIAVAINAAGDTVSVPWGKMSIPGIEGQLQPSVAFDANKQPQLKLGGTIKKRSLDEVSALAAAARKEMKKSSIYKGKAIRMDFTMEEDDYGNPQFDPQIHVPQFLRLNGVKRSDLVFRAEVEWEIQTSIFTPIENIEQLRSMGTPFRRGILAAGPYGVGKTLLANVTAKLCEENGITFIYLARTSDISQARAFAAQYAPAVIFAEDVDSILSGEDRDEDVNNVLNTIDGIEGKHDEVMIIFSTNHPERINRALLRPGRIDDVIAIVPPDALAVERLIRMYARETLPKTADLSAVGTALAGAIPAAVREVVERAKLAAVPKMLKGRIQITVEDLLLSAKSMKNHLDMLNEKPVVDDAHRQLDLLGTAIGQAMAGGLASCAINKSRRN